MQAQGSNDSAQERALKDEGTVLLHVLDRDPSDPSMFQLVSEIVGSDDKYTVEWDRYEQAVWRLAAVGLLLKGYERVKPSRQALRFNEILEANGVL